MTSNLPIIEKLTALLALERRTTAEMVELIREVDQRKLYLELGHASLFSYLTKVHGLTPASAQRRIDAARMMHAIPGIAADLKCGSLNLLQVSIVAQGARQKKKIGQPLLAEEKQKLLERVKHQDIPATQKTVAEVLDLPVLIHEKPRPQKDESVRLEITLSKEQMELLEKARDLLSHRLPNANWAEIFALLAADLVQKKEKTTSRNGSCAPSVSAHPNRDPKARFKSRSTMPVARRQNRKALRVHFPAAARSLPSVALRRRAPTRKPSGSLRRP